MVCTENSFRFLFPSIITFLGGGLAGSVLAIFINYKKEKLKAKFEEKIKRDALLSEIKQCKTFIIYNSRLKSEVCAPFVVLPNIVAKDILFSSRTNSYATASLFEALEKYVLCTTYLNELIKIYLTLIQSSDIKQIELVCTNIKSQLVSFFDEKSSFENIGLNNLLLNKMIDKVLLDLDHSKSN